MTALALNPPAQREQCEAKKQRSCEPENDLHNMPWCRGFPHPLECVTGGLAADLGVDLHREIEVGVAEDFHSDAGVHVEVDVPHGEQSWVVLADPEGSEFCVLADRRP